MSEQLLTDQELEAIRRRCAEAFAEPLAVVKLGQDSVGLCYSSEAARGSKAMPLAKYYGPNKITNAKFAAKAKHDVECLLAEVDRLKALVGLLSDVERLRLQLAVQTDALASQFSP
jgi:hypothetical protein